MIHAVSNGSAKVLSDGSVPHAPRKIRGAGRIANFVVVLCYAAIIFAVSLKHENWSDEADAWLVARDASFLDLYHLTPEMGTPALWYLLLMPLAKSGMPIAAMEIANIVLAT